MPRHTDPRHQNEPLEVRLRLDPNRIADARWYLGEIDRTVFATGAGHDCERHAAHVKDAVTALFGDG